MERGCLRISKGSLKICKGDKNPVSSPMKVTRPKVYITDSSSFKRLVQELTGNGSNGTPCSSPPKQEIHEPIPMIDVGDYGEPHDYSPGGEFSGGMELSDNTIVSSIEQLTPLATFTALQSAWLTQEMIDFKYQELDAVLGGMDTFPFYDEGIFLPAHQMGSSPQYFPSDMSGIL